MAGLAARLGRSLNHRIYVSTFEAAAHVIAENLAIGILAVDAVHSHVASLKLCVIPLTDEWSRREIVLCMRSRDALSPPARALVEHLCERSAQRNA